MRVSSATASLDSHESASRTGHEFAAAQIHVWQHIKRFFYKLDRLMTAIAHAEAGKLDEVQKILDEDRPKGMHGTRRAHNGGVFWL